MNLDILAQQLRDGLISLSEWQAGVREYLRSEYATAMTLQRGDVEFVTQSDWGYVGSSLKKQYGYLDGFAQDVATDPSKWLTGRLNNRLGLYKQSGYSALEDFKKRDMKKTGWTESRRVLGVAENCHTSKAGLLGCVELAAKGWQSIGTLPGIGGDNTPCSNNCKCNVEYRRQDDSGNWIVESEI